MRVRELTIVTSPPELVDPLVDATPVIPASMRVLEEVEDCAFIIDIANPARTSKQSWLVIVASPLAQHRLPWTKLLPHLLT